MAEVSGELGKPKRGDLDLWDGGGGRVWERERDRVRTGEVRVTFWSRRDGFALFPSADFELPEPADSADFTNFFSAGCTWE